MHRPLEIRSNEHRGPTTRHRLCQDSLHGRKLSRQASRRSPDLGLKPSASMQARPSQPTAFVLAPWFDQCRTKNEDVGTPVVERIENLANITTP